MQRRGSNHNRRAPFADQISRADRVVSGRTRGSLIPAHIYVGASSGDRLDGSAKAYIRRKLGMKLGKFSHSIERVSVRVKDINGPRGGRDKNCRIKVVLAGLPSIIVEEQERSVSAAINGALAKAEKTTKRQLQHRRQTPLRQSTRFKETKFGRT